MDGILSPWHWIIVVLVILLFFGPKRLPELGSSLGKGITSFKKGLQDAQEGISTSIAEAAAPEAAVPVEPASAGSTVFEGDEAKPQG